MGLSAELLSVDKDNTPYLTTREAIYQERHRIPNHNLLRTELFDLETIKGKIDHPPEGSKDCADALAGSTYTAHLNFDVDKMVSFYSEEKHQNNIAKRFWNV